MSSFKTVSAARETSYPVSVFLAPNSTPQEVARRILSQKDNKSALKAFTRFSVTCIGADKALAEAKSKVMNMGYTIRSANMTPSGINVYVTGKAT
jgi:hypothetical protein